MDDDPSHASELLSTFVMTFLIYILFAPPIYLTAISVSGDTATFFRYMGMLDVDYSTIVETLTITLCVVFAGTWFLLYTYSTRPPVAPRVQPPPKARNGVHKQQRFGFIHVSDTSRSGKGVVLTLDAAVQKVDALNSQLLPASLPLAVVKANINLLLSNALELFQDCHCIVLSGNGCKLVQHELTRRIMQAPRDVQLVYANIAVKCVQ